MYANHVVECDFAEVETRVLAAMEQNKGFKTGADLYGGHSIGSPERSAVKRDLYMELYGTPFNVTSVVTGRVNCGIPDKH